MGNSTQHPLATWLKASEITKREFAARIGISPSHLSLILARRKGASLSVALDAEAETGGEIPARAFDNRPPEAAAKFTRAAQAPDRDDPAGAVPAAAAGSISFPVTCSDGAWLVLRLVEAARPDLSRDEIFALGCSAMADRVGLPKLADHLEAGGP